MLGKALKLMRKEKKLTQEELGKLLNISRATIGHYETEETNPDFELLEKIAGICDYDIYFINKNTKKQFQVKNLKRKDI